MADDTTPTPGEPAAGDHAIGEPATAKTTPIEHTPPAPAPAPASASASAPAQSIAPQVVKSQRGAGWWVLTSAAAVGILVIGLFGGILIGQHVRGGEIGDRVSQSSQQGGFDRLPNQMQERMKDRVHERVKDRLQERRGAPSAPGNSTDGSDESTEPSPDSNG